MVPVCRVSCVGNLAGQLPYLLSVRKCVNTKLLALVDGLTCQHRPNVAATPLMFQARALLTVLGNDVDSSLFASAVEWARVVDVEAVILIVRQFVT